MQNSSSDPQLSADMHAAYTSLQEAVKTAREELQGMQLVTDKCAASVLAEGAVVTSTLMLLSCKTVASCNLISSSAQASITLLAGAFALYLQHRQVRQL